MSACHDVKTHSPTFCVGLCVSHSSWRFVSCGSFAATSLPAMFLPSTAAFSVVLTVVPVTHEKMLVSHVPVEHGVDASQKTGPSEFVITSGMPALCISV